MTVRRTTTQSVGLALIALAVVLAACSSGVAKTKESGGAETRPASTETATTTDPPTTTTTTTVNPTTTSTNPPTTIAEVENLDARQLVTALASDEMSGRDSQTPGSLRAQELLVNQLSNFAEPAFPDGNGNSGFLQQFGAGTNIVGIVPGTDLADEYVLIGAHYDHVGNKCLGVGAEDEICNGATDNATGVAEVIAIARSIVADGPPRRTLVVALWDAEEDGLLGSRWYAQNPVVPLDQTTVYLNFDGQGTNLLPTLATSTFLIGAETGGANLVGAARDAVESSPLDTVMLNRLFGQGRSDHASLYGAGVPVAFFTDITAGCYHTVKDDVDAVDFAKLDLQIAAGEALTRELLATDTPPVLVDSAPQSTYADAVQLLRMVATAEPDFGLLGPQSERLARQFLVDLQAVVDAGPDEFDDFANDVLLRGAVDLVFAFAGGPCDPYTS